MGETTSAIAPAAISAAGSVGRQGELSAVQQGQLVRALVAAWARRGSGEPPRHIETHISHVLLHGGHAYKLKKALATSFLDQSTLALRRRACEEELRLNRRLAPELYLDVVEITGTPQAPQLGRPHGDTSPVLDVAVRMRAFDEAGLWDRLAARGDLRADDIDDLAARLARFHAQAAAAADAGPGACFGTPLLARQALLDSLRDLQANAAPALWPDTTGIVALRRLREWEAATFARIAPAMARRRAAGRVREVHGDLHLGNVAREATPDGARCLVFDGIEFNPAFRWLDVMDEVAFMAMDLHAHGLPALAHRFVDAWLGATGDYDGLRVLGYYLVHRALVRAKVAQLRLAQLRSAGDGEDAAALGRGTGEAALAAALATAERYFAQARALAAPRPCALFITHGLPGSGKTTLTQGLVEAGGLVRVRADVERKRLAGLAPLQRSASAPGQGLYTPAMNDATQARLLGAATDAIEAGWPVILDATFIRRERRDEARQLAARLAVPFFVLRFAAAPDVLRERVRRRAAAGADASEADEAVLAAQQGALEPLQADELAHTFEVQPLPAAAGGAPGADSADSAPPGADWAPVLARLAQLEPSCAPAPRRR